jgi:hypothetical protein
MNKPFLILILLALSSCNQANNDKVYSDIKNRVSLFDEDFLFEEELDYHAEAAYSDWVEKEAYSKYVDSLTNLSIKSYSDSLILY